MLYTLQAFATFRVSPRATLTTKDMTLLTLLDIIVLTALALSAIAITWAIADYFRMAQDTESEGWDLPPIDLDTRDLGGAEHRKAILKGGQP